MSIRRATPADLTLMIGTMATWGMAFVAMKIATPETGPFWLAFGRTAFGFLTVLPFVLWAGIQWPDSARQWLLLMVLVLLNISIPIILIAWATLTLTAGVAALLLGCGPFLALFIGHFATRDERFTVPRLVAVLMGFGGIILVVGQDALSGLSQAPIVAQAAILLAALCYVVAGFSVRKISLPPMSMTAISLGVGCLFLLPISLVASGPPPIDISAKALSWLAFVGVFGTGLAFIVRYHLIQTIGYSMFSIGVNLIPVFGVFFGFLVLDESISLNILAALILIVGGLFVARVGGPKQQT